MRFFLSPTQETLNAHRTATSRYACGTIQRIIGLFDSRDLDNGHVTTYIDTQYPEAMKILGKLC